MCQRGTMDDKVKSVMTVIFPQFYKNNNVKNKIKLFFDEFDESIVIKLYDSIGDKLGENEELYFEKNTDDYNYILEYDCLNNYLSMKKCYNNSGNIIEKRLATYVQLIKNSVVEEMKFFPSYKKIKTYDTNYDIKAGLIIEELGNEIGDLKVKQQNGTNVATVNTQTYSKQFCVTIDENGEFTIANIKIYGGSVNFYNTEYNDCGYVEQKIELFQNELLYGFGFQKSRSLNKHLFSLADNKDKYDLFAENIEYNNVDKGLFEIMKHSVQYLGLQDKSKYYIRKYDAFDKGNKTIKLSNNKLYEISKEKYYLVQEDEDVLNKIISTYMKNTKGKDL